MKYLNKANTATFLKLIEGLDFNKTSHRKIENGAWMPLSIEIIEQCPNGSKVVMLCHYREQNGDLMADPEMNFLVLQNVMGTFVCPIYYRNDYLPFERLREQRSVTGNDVNYSNYRFNPRMQADHTSFANTWLKNIKDQGFLEKLQPMLA